MFPKLSFGSNTTNNFTAFDQPKQKVTGTAHVKYNPVIATNVVVKEGASQKVNVKHQCITYMKEYENKSLEELRLEDYVAGRKGSSSGMFGGFQPTTENKSLFGGTTSFAQPATTSAGSVFGGGAMSAGGFGQPSSFSFGAAAPAPAPATGLFGANKPAFGTTPTTAFAQPATTSAPSVFGFGHPFSFSFGANKPAFGTTPTTVRSRSKIPISSKPAVRNFVPKSGILKDRIHGWNQPALSFDTSQNRHYLGSPTCGTTESSTNSAIGAIVANSLSAMTNKKKLECMQEILEILREFSV